MRCISTEWFFRIVTARPRCTIAILLIPLLLIGVFALQLKKDTRAESFLPAGHEAVEYREKVKEIFGLEDPMLVAVVNRGPDGVFTPATLNLVSWLTERISEVPGVDPRRVMSLTTEKKINASVDGLLIEPFLTSTVTNREQAVRIRDMVMDVPLYVGSLVSQNGQGSMIVAELRRPDDAQEIYSALQALIDSAPVGPGDRIFVAGEGALMGNIGAYIDHDAQRLTPIVVVVVTLLLYFSYRTFLGVALPVAVALLTVGATLGAMSLTGKPFYVLTNGLPVILIAVAVADSIHILGQFYSQQAKNPGEARRLLVVRTMGRMWCPITITSLTTIAGFLSVYFASTSPPMKDFGLFSAFGIGVALLVSVILAPAFLLLAPTRMVKPRGQFSRETGLRDDVHNGVLHWLGNFSLRHSVGVFFVSALICLAGSFGWCLLETNDSDLDNFRTHEPVRVAHEEVNRLFDGAHTLDIVIETSESEGLFNPERLSRIDALQVYLESLPNVTATRSIVDYVKQMNRAVNDGRRDAYVLPENEDTIAQYFLLYSMTGDPTDFEEEVDFDYRLANIRVTLDSGDFVDEKRVVNAAETYINQEFEAEGLTATLSGRATVHYHWMVELMTGHIWSVLMALGAVWLMALISFRSLIASGLALLPVALSVLSVFAVMGFFKIWLGIGTSMSAAIAIGIGVDFSVHVIDRIKWLTSEDRRSLTDALSLLYDLIGRALFFNFLIVFVGFGLLVVSEAPGLIRFGALVAAAVATSFAGSLFLIPALIKVLRPSVFLLEEGRSSASSSDDVGRIAT